jgi:hypothetical protein
VALDAAQVPASFRPLFAGDEDARKKALALAHPDYTANSADWAVLLDAFEGSGGFQTGDYLWPYVRESGDDFDKRRKMVRYHNYVDSLVELYCRFVFTNGVNRSSQSTDYDAWTADVDGAGTSLETLLKHLVSVSLTLGHGGVLVDKTSEEPTGPTKADEKARPVASVFSALAIQDWRIEAGKLKSVKLREAAPQPSLVEELPTDESSQQFLLWDTEGWARFSSQGEPISAAIPNLGLVPLVILRSKPRYTSSMLGRTLVGSANIPRALVNRCSEQDEVIRTQAFSVMAVEVPADGSVDNAKADIGNVIGTSKAIVVRGKLDYKTPSQDVVPTIGQAIAFLIREMFRSAHIKFERDSGDAESGESIKLQYTELNEMLQGLAKALSAVEKQIARAWFAWMHPTKEAADAAFEAAQVEATYPTEFFNADLMTDLEAWAEAVRMGLGETMTKRIKKKAVSRIDPEMPQDELDKVHAEIDAMKDEPEPVAGPLDRGDPEAAAIAKAEQEMNSAA